MALVAVLMVVAVGVAAVVGSGVAAKRRGSGGRMRGWRLSWGVVGQSSSVCCHFRGAGGWFEAGDSGGDGECCLDVDVNSSGSIGLGLGILQ